MLDNIKIESCVEQNGIPNLSSPEGGSALPWVKVYFNKETHLYIRMIFVKLLLAVYVVNIKAAAIAL